MESTKAVAAVLLTLGLLSLTPQASASPATALHDFQSGKFATAQQEYERLAAQGKKNDLRLQFNAGTAAYRATNYDVAARDFTAATAAQNVKLQQAAYYNLGNTQFRLGAASDDLDALQTQWEAAIKSYQNAVTLAKNDGDAEHNLAFVKAAVEQIKLLREAARRARAEADESLKRRHYHRALEIMEGLQKNIAAKPFQEFTKKLKDIDEIANPAQTPAPAQP